MKLPMLTARSTQQSTIQNVRRASNITSPSNGFVINMDAAKKSVQVAVKKATSTTLSFTRGGPENTVTAEDALKSYYDN
jgi:hypothetical protein